MCPRLLIATPSKVVRTGAGSWLRIPLSKLRNDRYVRLHPELVQLLAAWTAKSESSGV